MGIVTEVELDSVDPTGEHAFGAAYCMARRNAANTAASSFAVRTVSTSPCSIRRAAVRSGLIDARRRWISST